MFLNLKKILPLPTSRITYEGRREKLEGQAREQRRDEQETQDTILKKLEYDKLFLSLELFQIFVCMDL